MEAEQLNGNGVWKRSMETEQLKLNADDYLMCMCACVLMCMCSFVVWKRSNSNSAN
jgi:hypothetical protein